MRTLEGGPELPPAPRRALGRRPPALPSGRARLQLLAGAAAVAALVGGLAFARFGPSPARDLSAGRVSGLANTSTGLLDSVPAEPGSAVLPPAPAGTLTPTASALPSMPAPGAPETPQPADPTSTGASSSSNGTVPSTSAGAAALGRAAGTSTSRTSTTSDPPAVDPPAVDPPSSDPTTSVTPPSDPPPSTVPTPRGSSGSPPGHAKPKP